MQTVRLSGEEICMSKQFTRIVVSMLALLPCALQADVTIGDPEVRCEQDPACFNRFHPDVPMIARAKPGERIVFEGRDAFDLVLDPDRMSVADDMPREGFGIVHALTGPVHIEGARAGDVIAVTLEHFEPADVGWTITRGFGFAGDDYSDLSRFIVWRINDEYAVSDALPGVRIPNASFPGVVSTLPDRALLDKVLAREAALLEAGGAVFPPDPARRARWPCAAKAHRGRPSACARSRPASTAATWTSATSRPARRSTCRAGWMAADSRWATSTTRRGTARSRAPRSRWAGA
ncbi:MAG: acetamidase/formamidase family protein [Xanthomonadales bacterium]|nr:acetamidase/formamidase family protein [Xanthomonadales bacterium]